ncbi:MAG TPA: SMC-Scp complex subunit ScpB, partial [Candidatus Mcinerneyibacteriales bacterium]|nr:SMC-Scp complex subunit ScpB [Candidatus Mcinerneyibacteriales bacterium]
MDIQDAKPVIEALIFSAREPLTAKRIREILGEEAVKEKDIEEAVRFLNEEYERDQRGFRIFYLNGGFEFRTSPEFGRYIEELYNMKKTFRLSKSVLETLA